MESAMERAQRLCLIQPGERLDDLSRDGLHILQRPDGFRFGMDSVLLSAFAAERVAVRGVDLGTGSGVLPLLICARRKGITFDAVEIQPQIADMARRTMLICGMEERIVVHEMDLRDAAEKLGFERYQLVVSNPPYGKRDGGLVNPMEERRIARHEGDADIEAISRSAFSLLQNGGRFCVVFPAYRLLELMDAMRAARLEPKRVRLIHPKYGKAPNLALVEAAKGVHPMLHFMPPLFIRDENGYETKELLRIYAE